MQFTFPSEWLEPGEYAVVVKNLAAFRLRYGDEIRVLGQFRGGIVLETVANGSNCGMSWISR